MFTKKGMLVVSSREQLKLFVEGRLTANIKADTCVIRAGYTSGGRDKKERKTKGREHAYGTTTTELKTDGCV